MKRAIEIAILIIFALAAASAAASAPDKNPMPGGGPAAGYPTAAKTVPAWGYPVETPEPVIGYPIWITAEPMLPGYP